MEEIFQLQLTDPTEKNLPEVNVAEEHKNIFQEIIQLKNIILSKVSIDNNITIYIENTIIFIY